MPRFGASTVRAATPLRRARPSLATQRTLNGQLKAEGAILQAARNRAA